MEMIPDGHAASAAGFSAAAVACGLKDSGDLDLALLFSERDCSAAALFTRNRIPAAPVVLDRETLAANPDGMRGVVVNAGVANACTGPSGMDAARSLQRMAADALGCRPDQVMVLSTGVIGVPLDLQKIETGLRRAAPRLAPDGGPAAARAIMTTDTKPKQVGVRLSVIGGEVTIGGMAKGSGMIHPDLATMLAVLTTDAAIAPDKLDDLLRQAAERSFNRISVDGDTSTNDTVLILANGASGVRVEEGAALAAFRDGLDEVCLTLAQDIVRDGEGASKFIALQVSGAREQHEALRVAQTIATSPLVKTAFAGGDPNWGRILAAAGRAGVDLVADRLSLWVGEGDEADFQLVRNGAPTGYDEGRAVAVFAAREIAVRLDLGVGEAAATVWTCDLTHEYVAINSEYRT